MKLTYSSPFVSLLLIPFLVVLPLPAQSSLPAPTAGAQGSAADNALSQSDLQIRMLESDGPQAKVSSAPVKGFTVAVANASGAAVADAAVAVRLPDSGPTGTFADGSHSAVVYTDATGRAHLPALRWSPLPGPLVMRVTATKANSHAALLFDETLTSDTATVVQVPVTPTPSRTVSVAPQPGQTATTPAVARTAATPLATPHVSVATPTSARPHALASTAAAQSQPSVSISGGSPDAPSSHSGKAKWIILAAVIAGGAGGAMAFVGKGKSNPAPAPPGLTIGTPSISVGHP